jgi:hypothetical protein
MPTKSPKIPRSKRKLLKQPCPTCGYRQVKIDRSHESVVMWRCYFCTWIRLALPKNQVTRV